MNMQSINLRQAIFDFLTSLENIRWAVVEAQPANEEHALAEQFESSVLDIAAHMYQLQSMVDKQNILQTNQLVDCLSLLVQINGRFYETCHSYVAVESLHILAKENPEQWGSWVEGVLDALSPCPDELHKIFETLVTCWRFMIQSNIQVNRHFPEQISNGNPLFYSEVNND